MALAVLILACFMFYGTSRYFPRQDISLLKEHKTSIMVLAGAISLLSLYLFSHRFDGATALLVWLTAFMTLLSAIILSVKMNVNWGWAWGGVCVLSILFDLF